PWLAKLYPEELRTEGHTLFQKLVSFTTLNESISYCVYKQNDGICEFHFLATYTDTIEKNKMMLGHGCDHDVGAPTYESRTFAFVSPNTFAITEYATSVHDSLIGEDGWIKKGQDFLEAETSTDSTIRKFEIDPWGQIKEITTYTLSRVFTLNDAEKTLGQPCQLSDSSTQRTATALLYKCSYKADTTVKGKTGNIYLMIERYDKQADAQQKYSSIKKSNADHQGVKTLSGLGDEAYFHSDEENFCFIMARKGNYVLTMKVNKLTALTSVSEFNSIAKRIASNF
ncbi:MAG: hypothetical protein AB1458_12685, partial [Bacteroidota bacterium]